MLGFERDHVEVGERRGEVRVRVGPACHVQNHAIISSRHSIPSASTTAQAPASCSKRACCEAPDSSDESRLKSSNTCGEFRRRRILQERELPWTRSAEKQESCVEGIAIGGFV